jgi:16S rRNA (guanine527-N7)-methyltransferase
MTDSARSLLHERAELAGIHLEPSIVDRLLTYYGLLERWNRKINLTSLSDPAQAIDRLLLEPVAAAQHLPPGSTLADLGSGGGSPAIPLAIALNSPRLLMVESRSRKAAFLREATRHVGVAATVEAVRFEELRARTEYMKTMDVVSIRAVRPDAETLSLAQWLTRAGGQVAYFGSTADLDALPPNRSTWNITPSAILVTFHVEHQN